MRSTVQTELYGYWVSSTVQTELLTRFIVTSGIDVSMNKIRKCFNNFIIETQYSWGYVGVFWINMKDFESNESGVSDKLCEVDREDFTLSEPQISHRSWQGRRL